ncbi:MAG: hypothetical protein UV59_C0010G0012 [Candidatus Gottesmanbacteria bacterium GW2011_GWA1_43_11]|uniref:Uncharacterized protein n=1 Tax=Candidatus Gottesmanbacteria bacterium GW2011_GWA1_43_11 TaxID=1618436 RepID=A0A0G1EQ42_9BACT|nr:MAG: hypothetical protein UV59_C0010G0012 [Candidatus Gottesmanbacteria bacterium GW2011_GWA1_43_11]
MFTDDLVDARSDYRKRQDKQHQQLRQTEMFSARETVQIGVNPCPWLKGMARSELVLEIQDVRTHDEKERDWWREAQSQIAPMFDGGTATNNHEPDDNRQSEKAAEAETKVVYEAPNLRQIGFRAYARRNSIPVRWKGVKQGV